jgi:hypothetical protein
MFSRFFPGFITICLTMGAGIQTSTASERLVCNVTWGSKATHAGVNATLVRDGEDHLTYEFPGTGKGLLPLEPVGPNSFKLGASTFTFRGDLRPGATIGVSRENALHSSSGIVRCS